MNDKIAQYVRETMKRYGVSDRKLERELILACRDEYEMRLADGAYEDEAFKAAVENIEEIAKSRIPRRNKFAFALGMGILALCLSVLEMLASLLVARLDIYRASMPVCIAGIVVIIVLYVILKRRQLLLVRFPDSGRHAGFMDRFYHPAAARFSHSGRHAGFMDRGYHPAAARFSLQLYAGERS